MNFIKSYANTISDFVTNVIDEPSERTEKDAVAVSSDNQSSAVDVKDADNGRLFGWLPNLSYPNGDNAIVYYMNSLASLGSDFSPEQTKTTSDGESEKSTIVEDIHEVSLPQEPVGAEQPSLDTADSDLAFANWINGFSSRTGKVWHQVKQDLSEVVSAISVEPKVAVTRTASSVRQKLSSVADAARKFDTSQFSVLPETQSNDKELDAPAVSEGTKPPEYSDLPTFSNLRADVTSFVQGVFSSLFGQDESKHTSTKDKREARLHVLRADPATYETEPPLPPEHLGVINYADWRAAYFNEVTCQPLPGIPLTGARNAENVGRDVDELLQPPQPSPEELLEQNPFMRNYLSQLVRVEGQADNKGISDGDFWSRYYYRVWLLDVTEYRRKRLAERVESKSLSILTPDSGTLAESTQDSSNEKNASTDWFDASDVDALSSPSSPNEKEHESIKSTETEPTISTPAPVVSPRTVATDHDDKLNKRAGKQRKKRGKKRSEGDRGGEVDEPNNESTKSTAVQPDQSNILKSTSPMVPLAMERHKKNASVHSVAESDEPVTSGSSSVVVLSNSEDDPDGVPPTPRSHVGLDSHTAVLPDEHSDDWGELSADDFETVPRSTTVRPAPSVEKGDEEDDVWDNWT